MKIAKSKMSIAVIGFTFASVIAAISYASLNRAVDQANPNKDIKPVKLLVSKSAEPKIAPHQEKIEAYLDEMLGYLQTPPRDGVFGSDRIPTLHGKESDDIEAYKNIQDLEGKIRMESAVIGTYTDQEAKEESQGIDDASPADKTKLSDEDKVRLNYVHFVSPESSDTEKSNQRWEAVRKAMVKFGVELQKSSPENLAKKVTVDGKPSWLIAKAVHASVNSCYKCHTNIQPGKPIGYTVALVTELK